MVEIITPKNKQHWLELRSHNINSTEVSSLFGVNPYQTELELWHIKKDKSIVEIEENDRMFIGSGLEAAIGNMAAQKMGWEVRPMKDYIQHTNYQIGSSFDFQALQEFEPTAREIIESNYDAYVRAGSDKYYKVKALIEIKNVDYLQYKSKWIEHTPEDIEAPPHIELQCQTQMLVSGISELYLCVLVGGNDLKILHRKANPDIQEAILEKVTLFWQSIKDNTPPEIDFEKDAEFISSLHNYAQPNSILSLEGENEIRKVALEYKAAGEDEAKAKKRKSAAKAKLLTLIGEYEKVKHPEFSISAGMRGPVEVAAHTREGFRDFRVFMRDAE